MNRKLLLSFIIIITLFVLGLLIGIYFLDNRNNNEKPLRNTSSPQITNQITIDQIGSFEMRGKGKNDPYSILVVKLLEVTQNQDKIYAKVEISSKNDTQRVLMYDKGWFLSIKRLYSKSIDSGDTLEKPALDISDKDKAYEYLKKLKGKNIVLHIYLTVSQEDAKNSQLVEGIKCNNRFAENIGKNNYSALSCTPVVWQISAYENI